MLGVIFGIELSYINLLGVDDSLDDGGANVGGGAHGASGDASDDKWGRQSSCGQSEDAAGDGQAAAHHGGAGAHGLADSTSAQERECDLWRK